MIAEHLPALQVVIPLLAAPIAVLIRQRTAVWVWATGISWLTLAMSWALLQQVLETGPISYELGGWAPPIGIEYRVEVINAYVLLIVSSIGALVFPFARHSVDAEIPRRKQHLFYSAMLLNLSGLLGITITGDAFNIFVFLEIASLSGYVLVAMGPNSKALTSAFRYLVMGTIGGTFYLIGVGLLYNLTGTLNILDIAARLQTVGENRTLLVAFTFLATGVSLKLAVFPLHMWLPNAYAYAPSAVTAFIAATFTKVAFYLLLRIIFTFFGVGVAFAALGFDNVLMPLALIGIFAGSLVAIYQTNIKRMLAYSSVAQIGYMVLGVSFASTNGLTGGIVHLFNHAMTKGGLFMVMACIALRLGSVQLDDMRGIGRRMPLTMGAFVLGGLSLIGVPLTVGFVSKWYLILAAVEQNAWPIAVMILISSLLAVVYIWRVIEIAYFKPAPEGAAPLKEAPLGMLVPTWIMIGATVYFGLFTDTTLGVARLAAEQLLGVVP